MAPIVRLDLSYLTSQSNLITKFDSLDRSEVKWKRPDGMEGEIQ